MADFGDRRRIADFLNVVHQTRIWLDTHFDGDDLPPKVAQDVIKLRAYLRHCHRRVLLGQVSVSSFDNRRRKIRMACVELWQARP